MSTHHPLRELRSTLALAAPIAAGHIGQILIGLTDSVMIGQVGTVPLAASAFVGAVFGVVFVTAIGLQTAVSVRAAFAHGAQRPGDAAEALRHGQLVALLAGLLGAAGVHWLSGHLDWLGQPPEVAAEARLYLIIVGWSLVPSLLFLTLKYYHEALNRPWIPFVWVMIGVGLNAGLNWIFIYGHCGMPALGLAGAGWATLAARTVLLAGLWIQFSLTPSLAAARPGRWLRAIRWGEIRELLHLGLPAAVQLLFESGLFAAAGLLMGWLGTVALAAHQVALSCAATTFMVPLAISQALSVRIGQARGAGETHRLRDIGFGGIAAGAVFMGLCALVFMVAGRFLAGLFIHDDAVIDLAARLLVVAAVFQIFDGTQVTSIGALRGLADVRGPTVITFVGYWALALPFAWVAGFPFGFGAIGVWGGMVVGLGVCATLLLLRFGRQTRPVPAA